MTIYTIGTTCGAKGTQDNSVGDDALPPPFLPLFPLYLPSLPLRGPLAPSPLRTLYALTLSRTSWNACSHPHAYDPASKKSSKPISPLLLVTYAANTLVSLKKTKTNTPAHTNNYLSQGVIRYMASNHNPL